MMVKIGNVELTEKEAFNLQAQGKYIVTYSKVYQLHYSQAQGLVYGAEVYAHPMRGGIGLVKRGRWQAMSGSEVNNMLGFELLR